LRAGGVQHTIGKLLKRATTLLETAFQSKVYTQSYGHAKLWAPKVEEVPTLAISRLPLGNPGTKCHLDMGLVERHIVYYKGEGDGFPPSPGRGEFYKSELPVVRPSTKSAPTLH